MRNVSFRLGSMREHPVQFSIHIPNGSATVDVLADQLFAAANRIDWIDVDLDALEHDYQKLVRRAIDQYQAPSMSVGDQIIIDIDGGLRRRIFEVAPVGWIITDIDNT